MDNYTHDGSLILNDNDWKSEKNAWNLPILLFRWKLRICKKCDKEFDIGIEGKFYECGGCV
tara:strand:- start:292 stop:474 length:183 start_codon:yes stop_codon:yes gene_type:complete